MPQYTIIKLTQLTPLHIGKGRDDFSAAADELHSDTLTSALAALRATQGQSEGIKEFMESFALSSAFPFWLDYYFLPVPQGKVAVTVNGQEEYQYRKQLKKLRYAEASLWKRLAQGETVAIDRNQLQGPYLLPDGWKEHYQTYKARQIDRTRLDEAEKDAAKAKLQAAGPKISIYKNQVMQRVCVPRDGEGDASPFYFDWRYFDTDAGLYCLADAQGDRLAEIKELFEQLGEYGIGSDKNLGGGHFVPDFPKETFTYDTPGEANAQELLSLYIPTEDEHKQLLEKPATYSLVRRGGYMAGSEHETLRHLHKRMVYAFGVGSVFHTLAPLTGAVVDLRPAWNSEADPNAPMHPVYRSGRPIALPIISKQNV